MARVIQRAQKQVEDGGNPFWISYADLMTALAMLFLVVMSLSMVAIASRPMVEKKERETAIQGILNRLEERAKEKSLGLEINRATHTISFGERASFTLNSYQLSSIAQESLRSLVPLLLELEPEVRGEERTWLKRIHIEGYTDATGSYLYNVNLSLNRAQAVVCALFSAELPGS
ncbi:MAG: OmpA family protein, partial [Magnetococcales bacterium]|nr:OmpA family protein [Magnetococcales bacterium]